MHIYSSQGIFDIQNDTELRCCWNIECLQVGNLYAECFEANLLVQAVVGSHFDTREYLTLF